MGWFSDFFGTGASPLPPPPVATQYQAPQSGFSGMGGAGLQPSGMVSAGGGAAGFGAPQVASTTGMNLPEPVQAALPSGQGVINEAAYQPIRTGTIAMNNQYPVLDFRMQPTFAQGGMVGEGGMPDMGGRAAGMVSGGPGRMDQKGVEMQLQQMLNKNPQMVAQIKQTLSQAMNSGQLSREELNMAVQLAMVALQNPEMYPYVRRFAIQRGLASEQELSPNYDEGLIFIILLAARAVQGEMSGQSMPAMNPAPVMSMADGGYVEPGTNARYGGYAVGPGTGTSDSIPIRVSKGEYVIPAHVVKMKGKEFFDSMLEKYKEA